MAIKALTKTFEYQAEEWFDVYVEFQELEKVDFDLPHGFHGRLTTKAFRNWEILQDLIKQLKEIEDVVA